MIDVSIIIVNYNTKDLLNDCITSIKSNTSNISYEILVSDNGSTDDSLSLLKEKFPEVIIIENKENLGFGTANNRALQFAKGKYILYLNSDTVFLNNALKYFIDYWENNNHKEQIGALGCNLVDNDFELTHSCGCFPSYNQEVKSRLITFPKIIIKRVLFSLGKNYQKTLPNPPEFTLGEVDYITGADLFLLNNDFAKYDEQFFLYYEEVDLELRLKENNLKRIMIDGPKIQHLCKVLKNQKNDVELFKSFSHIHSDKSCFKYFRKNTNKKCSLLKFAIKINWLAAGVKHENFI